MLLDIVCLSFVVFVLLSGDDIYRRICLIAFYFYLLVAFNSNAVRSCMDPMRLLVAAARVSALVCE